MQPISALQATATSTDSTSPTSFIGPLEMTILIQSPISRSQSMPRWRPLKPLMTVTGSGSKASFSGLQAIPTSTTTKRLVLIPFWTVQILQEASSAIGIVSNYRSLV